MKHTTHRMISMLLVLSMIASLLIVPVSAANRFEDVSDSAWFAGAVGYVQEQGWMNGVSESSFAPYGEVTRAMFVTVLARFAGAEQDSRSSAFSDVPVGTWYTGAVTWAAEKGIVNGVGQGAFAPGASISRQDMCTMLARFLNAQGYNLERKQSRSFKDAAGVSPYAAEAVELCAATGLIAGFEDGTFRPFATTSRAQVATILMRLDLLLDGQEAPGEPMPAQDFEGSAYSDMNVSVAAPEGALPENTTMSVSRVTDEATLNSIYGQVNGRILGAADISFLSNGVEQEPQKPVEVQIRLDSLAGAEHPVVYHFGDDGELEPVSSEMLPLKRAGAENVLRFYAKDFSIYAVVDNPQDEMKTLTLNFKYVDANGQDVNIATVYVKESDKEKKEYVVDGVTKLRDPLEEIIYDPGTGDYEMDDDEIFQGWTAERNYTASSEAYSVDQIREYIRNDYGPIQTDAELTVYAKFMKVYTVSYVDEDGVSMGVDNVMLTKAQKTANEPIAYQVNREYVPGDGSHGFLGWKATEDSYKNIVGWQTVSDGANHVFENETDIQITGNVDLMVYAPAGFWLSFHENPDGAHKGAAYTPPVFCPQGVIPAGTALPSLTLTGYTLEGWYKSTAYTAGEKVTSVSQLGTLTRDLSLFANWSTNDETTYSIVFWKQNVNDSKDLTDNSKKHYDYWKMTTATGRPGDPIPVPSTGAYSTGITYEDDSSVSGFEYRWNDAGSRTVAADGSTVLNIYYDRKLVTFTFNTPVYTPMSGSYDSNKVYRVKQSEGYYQKVSTPEIGHSYLIGYTTGGYTYILSTTNRTGNYQTRMVPSTRTAVSGVSNAYTFALYTEDYGTLDQFLYTIGGTSSALTFYNSNTGYYINYNSSYPGVSTSTNYNKWIWTNGRVKNTQRYETYSWYFAGSGTDSYLTDTSSTGTTFELYEYVETEATYSAAVYGGSYWYTTVSYSDLQQGNTYYYYSESDETLYTVTYGRHSGYVYNYTTNKWVYVSNQYRFWYYVESDGYYYAVDEYDTVYERINKTVYEVTWEEDYTYTGLYGQKLKQNHYDWPTDYRWYDEDENKPGYPSHETFTSFMEIFAGDMEVFGDNENFNAHVYHILQNLDGSWPEYTYKVATNTNSYMTFRGMSGFTPYQFRIKIADSATNYWYGKYADFSDSYPNRTDADGWTAWLNPGNSVKGQNGYDSVYQKDPSDNSWNATTGGIEFRYKRNTYAIHYLRTDGTELSKQDGILYEDSLAAYGDYEPEVPAGVVFAGWYKDAALTEEFIFDEESMPLNGVSVYAKLTDKRYRVFLYPNVDPADNRDMQTDLEDSSKLVIWNNPAQAENFGITYDNAISSGAAIQGTRSGYELVGWYTDPQFKHLFHFGTKLMDSTTVSYDKTIPTEYRTKTVTVNGATATVPDRENGHLVWTTNADVDRSEYVGMLQLYARWRHIIEGAKGIKVEYVVPEGLEAPEDSRPYQDQADATAMPGTPAPDGAEEGTRFMYWVVQRYDEAAGDFVPTETNVYPGATFSVNLSDAKQAVNPAYVEGSDADRYIYTVRLVAYYANPKQEKATHIYWVGNGGVTANGETYVDSDAEQINKPIDIQSYQTFTREGYTFLGWARVDEHYDENGDVIFDQRDLTIDDVWLEFHVNENNEIKWTVDESQTRGRVEVSQIAADEDRPYHMMYAVWGPAHFYVFHSATGRLEAFEITTKSVTNSVTGLAHLEAEPVDLTALLTPGYRYGGYYRSYGGVNTDAVEGKAGAYETNTNRTPWTAVQATEANHHMSAVIQTNAQDYRFVKYEGVALNGEKKFWDKTDAYAPAGAADPLKDKIMGSSMVPSAGTVYYLKEVPEEYLVTKAYMVKKDDKITSLFLISVIDDIKYAARFINNESCRLATSLTIHDHADDGGTNDVVIRPNQDDFSVPGGYLLVQQVDLSKLAADTTSIEGQAKWTTLDYVDVLGPNGSFDFPKGATVPPAAAGLLQPQVVQNRRTLRGASAEETEAVGELIFTVDGSVVEISE